MINSGYNMIRELMEDTEKNCQKVVRQVITWIHWLGITTMHLQFH